MSLPYESVVAEPDNEKFFECLAKKNVDKMSGSLTNMTAWNNFEGKWKAATRAYTEGSDQRILQLQNQDYDVEFTGLEAIRMCARNQHLKVDALSLARQLLTTANQSCFEEHTGRSIKADSSAGW